MLWSCGKTRVVWVQEDDYHGTNNVSSKFTVMETEKRTKDYRTNLFSQKRTKKKIVLIKNDYIEMQE